jgi:membrane protein implicated in regulation of membrane protease activity
MDEREISGYIMAVFGFVMILINALSYLLGWTWKSPAFTILGLVLIVIGAKTARKTS